MKPSSLLQQVVLPPHGDTIELCISSAGLYHRSVIRKTETIFINILIYWRGVAVLPVIRDTHVGGNTVVLKSINFLCVKLARFNKSWGVGVSNEMKNILDANIFAF